MTAPPAGALVARLRMHARDCVSAADMDTDTVLSAAQIDDMADALNEAAEAIAEQPAASVDVEGLRELVAELRHESESDDQSSEYECGEHSARAEVANRLETLIDSAGGAKGITGSVSPQMRDASAASPTMSEKPAEGDGAVADALMVVNDAANDARHAGDYAKANALVRARVTLYRASTRPAATAVVPEGASVDSIPVLGDLLYSVRHALSAAEEGEDYSLDRKTLDAMAAFGLLDKTGRGRWSPTEAAAQFAAAFSQNPAAPAAPKGGVVDEAMARRYLAAQKDYIGKVDAAFGRQVAGALHGDDVIGACMAGLTAALAQQEPRHYGLADGEAASA